MDQETNRAATRDATDRWVPRVLTGMAALLVISRIWLALHRLYDPDELEHLHAGFSVWRGLVPYRDFFEQHGPILWYVSLPLFELLGPSLTVLSAGRMIVWTLSALTFYSTWVLGRQLYGRWSASCAIMLLALMPPFQEKSVEWRPDNPAVVLLLGGIWCLVRVSGGGHWGWAAAGGSLLSASFLCTQKVAYIGCGLVAGWLWSVWRTESPLRSSIPGRLRHAMPFLVAMVAGWLVSAAFTAACFSQLDALEPYFRMTVLMPLEWQTRERALPFFKISLASAPVFWGLFAAGVALAAFRAFQSNNGGERIIAAGAIAHLCGLFVVPAAFHQYYLPLYPVAALLGAAALDLDHPRDSMAATPRFPARRFWLWAITIGVAGLGLAWRLPLGHFHIAWTIVGLVALLLGALAWSVHRERMASVVLLLSLASTAAPFLWLHYNEWAIIQRHQRSCIEQLTALTEPDDQIFDGFTGYGALRPHAYFFFWINDHSAPMIPLAERTSGMLAAISDRATRVILVDQYLRKHLPPECIAYIEQHYAVDLRFRCPGCVVLVRRGRELPITDGGNR